MSAAIPEERLEARTVEAMTLALVAVRDRLLSQIPAIMRADEEFRRTWNSEPGNALEFTQGRIRGTESALASMPAIVSYLEGNGPYPGQQVLDPIITSDVLPRIPGLADVHRIRLWARPGASRYLRSIPRVESVADARSIVDLLERIGYQRQEAVESVIERYFTDPWSGSTIRADQMVGLLLEGAPVFDVVLGLAQGEKPVAYSDNRSDALAVLEASPELPERFVPVVIDLATASAKTHRRAAQRVLERHRLAPPIAEAALRSKKSDQRAAAMLWVEQLGGSWAVDLLTETVAKEKAPSAKAVGIAALERLGSDIRSHLTPEVLFAEAANGVAQGIPSGIAWFPFDALPVLSYAGGTPVPDDVVRWWVILAWTLRDPLGVGLLPRYLQTLDPSSAQQLSRSILFTWLARDTTPLSDDVVLERAMQAVARHERALRALFPAVPELPESVDDLFALLDEARLNEGRAAPSAIADKGLLALASALPGAELAELVRQYMRRQHLKRAQIEALLHVASVSDDAEPLQLLVATARRYRTATVQKTARALVEQVAERRGWSADELADRMIPTAGLDSSRTLALDYGPREFTARWGTSLTLQLASPDGVLLKTLPEPRLEDTEAAAARDLLVAARKELKAAVALQRRRLFDAMALRRSWPVAQWREQILEHPVMGMLAAGLVWHVGDSVARPTIDGEVLDVGGAPVAEPEGAVVSIAHPTTVTPQVIAEWRNVPPPVNVGFDQFRAIPVAAGDDLERIDREGRPGETFTLRGRARALEWEHGPTGDDVRFDEYVKSFPAAALQAVVTFSGSQLPETSQPIEFGVLRVRRLSATGRTCADVPLQEVPPALFAELVADYEALTE